MQALRLVEFAFQRYYRLDCSGERGLCDRAVRSCERSPAALKPAVTLAHLVKDLCHPQDQAWLRALLCDAALNRFKHLEASAGLRGGTVGTAAGAARAGLKKAAPAGASWDDLAKVVGHGSAGVRPPAPLHDAPPP